MAKTILVVTVLSLVMVACGKSDEGTKVVNTGKDVSDTKRDTVSVTQSTVSENAVTQAPGQADNAAAGEAVYKRACAGCHMTGAAGAPRIADVPAWKSRIAKGDAALIQSAIAGVPGTAMMARGACGACSDDDIRAAVEYMIEQSR
jgi:cytochrome c5